MRLLTIIPKVVVLLIGASVAMYGGTATPAHAHTRHLHPSQYQDSFYIPAHSGAILDCGPDDALYFDVDLSVKVGAHWRVFYWNVAHDRLRTHVRYGGRVYFDGWRVANTTNRRAIVSGRCVR